MEMGKLCGAAFIDLTKAFDTIDHGILLSKMSKLGVSSVAFNWFESYLGNRKQRVSVGHELSDELPVSYGVPQGSILGPLLFNIYIDKLPTILSHSEVSLCADDTVIYCYHANFSEIERNLNEDLLNVAQWLNENKLTLNLDKTNACLLVAVTGSHVLAVCLSQF
jgi:retron-type reverse transcriptase